MGNSKLTTAQIDLLADRVSTAVMGVVTRTVPAISISPEDHRKLQELEAKAMREIVADAILRALGESTGMEQPG